ncbi:hypothetical protein HAX54_050564 [Datura stramonium]|uniref:MADS-box domain-containing protein n=1 Tax=Datura stramonium TaxID=4076 RepID=A0ABS8SYL0_DATST|nr:hypothetical protein [Datura stramonium]
MPRKKVKLAFIENIIERKASYKKRQKGLLKKAHELNTLCDVEMTVIISSPYHNEPAVFPNNDVAINTFTKFRNLPELEKLKNMTTQEKFTKQRTEKIDEQMRKVRKENRVREFTNKMYEMLNGEDIHIGMHPYDLNDLSYVINQNIKHIHEAIKVKTDGEGSTSNTPQSIVEPMIFYGTSSEGQRSSLLAPVGALVFVAQSMVQGETSAEGPRDPLLVPNVDSISKIPPAAPLMIPPDAPNQVPHPMFHLMDPSRNPLKTVPLVDPSQVSPSCPFSSQIFPSIVSQTFTTIPQQMILRSAPEMAAPVPPTITASPKMAPPMSASVFPQVTPQMNPSKNNSLIGASASINNFQNCYVGFPQSPTLSEMLDWNDDEITSLYEFVFNKETPGKPKGDLYIKFGISLERKKVKLAFIENISERKSSYKKRQKGFLKKAHELNTLCDVEMAVIISSPYHNEPAVFPNNDVAINTFTKFRDLPELEKLKNMTTQEKFTKQRTEKIDEQMRKVRKENRVREFTNKMYEMLNGEDIHIGMHPYDLNDLSYVINQNIKHIHEAIKVKTDGEGSTSNTPQSIVEPMIFDGTSSEGPRSSLLAPVGASVFVAQSMVQGETSVEGPRDPLLVPNVDSISKISPAAPLMILSDAPTQVPHPMFHLMDPSRNPPKTVSLADPSQVSPSCPFSSQIFPSIVSQMFTTIPQQMILTSAPEMAAPVPPKITASPKMAPPMSASVFPQVTPQMNPSKNNSLIGASVPINNFQNCYVDFPQSPALSEMLEWNDDVMTLLDDPSFNNINVEDLNHNNKNF